MFLFRFDCCSDWMLSIANFFRWSEEIKDSVKTDSLQRLHSLHNLAEVLRMAPAGSIPPTLRDGSLEEEADQLKKRYLGRALAQVEIARSTLASLTIRVMSFKYELEDKRLQLNDMWWTALIQWSSDTSRADKLVQEIKDKMNEENESIVYAILILFQLILTN